MRGLAAFAVLCFAACQAPPPEMTEGEAAAIEEAVLAQANALIETQNSFDADGFLAQFSTEDLDWMNDSDHYTSYEAVAETLRKFFAGLDAFDSGWKTVSVEVISRNAALCRGEWWGEQVRGDVVIRYEPVFWTALHELQADGTWKITRVHQSFPDPATQS